MRNRTLPTSLLALSLALAGTTSALAQDAPELAPEVTYSSGSISGEIVGFIEPTEAFPAEGLREMRGWSVVGVPIEMDDPRVSGLLTIAANGTGQDFENGFANIETRTYRLENDGGVWTGSGAQTIAVGEDELLIELETALLTGEGDYDGLIAFFISTVADDERVFEIVVVEGELAPAPDAVSATAVQDATGS
ncbi:MAG: hypothetical protein AB1Z67_02635 [Candidatus Limnocylindrales bacterium]